MIKKTDKILELLRTHEKTLNELKTLILNGDNPEMELNLDMEENTTSDRHKIIKNSLEFVYHHLQAQSILFGVRTGILQLMEKGLSREEILSKIDFPNKEYLEKTVSYFERMFENENPYKINFRDGCVFLNVDPDLIAFYQSVAKTSYYYLISNNHPNITLGFEKDSDLWDIWLHGTWFRVVREVIADLMSPSNGDSILDVGCGSASPLFFAPLVGPNGLYTGIDRSKNLLNMASRRIRSSRIDWAVLKNLSVEERITIKRKYDYVVCNLTFKYIHNFRQALKNMVNAVARGGKILIFNEFFPDVTPKFDSSFSFYNSLIPSFNRYISLTEIEDWLSSVAKDFDLKVHDGMFLEITLR